MNATDSSQGNTANTAHDTVQLSPKKQAPYTMPEATSVLSRPKISARAATDAISSASLSPTRTGSGRASDAGDAPPSGYKRSAGGPNSPTIDDVQDHKRLRLDHKVIMPLALKCEGAAAMASTRRADAPGSPGLPISPRRASSPTKTLSRSPRVTEKLKEKMGALSPLFSGAGAALSPGRPGGARPESRAPSPSSGARDSAPGWRIGDYADKAENPGQGKAVLSPRLRRSATVAASRGHDSGSQASEHVQAAWAGGALAKQATLSSPPRPVGDLRDAQRPLNTLDQLLCFPLSSLHCQYVDFPGADDFIFSECKVAQDGKIEGILHRDSPPEADSAWLADAKAQLYRLITLHGEIVHACQAGLSRSRSSNTTAASALKHALNSLQAALWLASFPMDCGDLRDAQTQLSAVLEQVAACRTLLDSLAQASPGAQHADNAESAESAESALATLATNLEVMQSSCLAWSAKLAQPALPTSGTATAASNVALAPDPALPAPVGQLDATVTGGPTRAPDQFLAFLDDLFNTVDRPIAAQPEASGKPDHHD